MKRPVRRPTEDAALRLVDRTPPPPLPSVDVLFERILFAYAADDMHGLGLFGRAIVRVSHTR